MTADTVKHTPGPWSGTRDAQFYYSVYAGEQRVATVSDLVSNHGKANARLIAAAPELLEALKHLCEFIDREGPAAKEWEAISDWCEKGSAAIAKAEGRS